jgi:hypothetical protein
MQQTPVMQRVVDDADHEHSHAPMVHTHDHYHVTHHHRGTVLGEFDHRSAYHEHEHNHAPLVHAHKDRDLGDESADHDKEAHVHDHSAPTQAGR